MRQIDYIIEENKVIKKLRKMGSSVTKGVKKFFAPLTPEEREAAGLQDRHKYLTGGDVKPMRRLALRSGAYLILLESFHNYVETGMLILVLKEQQEDA